MEWFIVCLLLLQLVALSTALFDFGQPEVTTNLGKIRGRAVDFNGLRLYEYLGVPFAKPPVGRLRFKKPESVEPWDVPIDATKYAPACPQYTPSPFPWYDNMTGHDEDCLYLNIWTPAASSKARSVMFWIYCGGLFLGSNRMPIYNGEALIHTGIKSSRLMALNDVLVVVINYRLGPLGYLYSATDDAPGNMGIYDVLMALQWVNVNIEAFGGDKNSITIMGESSGSIIVSLLNLSPLTKGLYKRAIMESGSSVQFVVSDDSNIDIGQKIAEAVGCANDTVTLKKNPKDVVGCLRGVDANGLAEAVGLLYPHSSRVLLPQAGDELLGDNPKKSILNGDFHDMDLLIGNNKDEGSFQMTSKYPEVFGFFGDKNPQINKSYGEEILKGLLSSFKEPDKVVNFYLGDQGEDDYDEIRRQTYTASGDYTLLCPTVYYAEKYAEKGNDVYFYFFTHRPSTSPWAPWMGATHFGEVQFVFGQPLIHPEKYEEQEVRLSQRMMRMWTNFARTGSPGYDWPLYSKDEKKLRILDTSTKQSDGYGPHRENCDFFRSYLGF